MSDNSSETRTTLTALFSTVLPVLEQAMSFALPILATAYLVDIALGATWSGMLNLNYRREMVGGLLALMGVWSLTRAGVRWRQFALDYAIPLWLVAILFSMLANPEVWRRSVLAASFIGLYTVVWYMCADMLATGRLRRSSLVDGILIASLPICRVAFNQWFDKLQHGVTELPRIKSTLDNPNPLGTVAALVMLLAAGRTLSVRSWGLRILIGLYTLAWGIVLILTGSRGAWIGAAAGALVLGWLLLDYQNIRINIWLIIGVVVLGIVLMFVVTAARGWDGQGRERIYSAAIQLFAEKPLTGHGLNAFGSELIRLIGVLPKQVPHSHAHNILLHVGAELGLFGLLALVITIVAISRAMWRNWQATQSSEKLLLAGCIGAAVAFGIHHLFDMTATQVAVALFGALTLALSSGPVAATEAVQATLPAPQGQGWRRWSWREVLISALIILVAVDALYETTLYSQYVAAFGKPSAEAITAAQIAVNNDPAMPPNVLLLSYLLYRSGNTVQANAVFQRYCHLEPYYQTAPNDAQIAILHYQRSSLVTSQAFWLEFSCAKPS